MTQNAKRLSRIIWPNHLAVVPPKDFITPPRRNSRRFLFLIVCGLNKSAGNDKWYNYVGLQAKPYKIMKAVKAIAFILVIIGGLNWLLVGAFGYDLVASLLGEMSALSRVVYVLVGISAIIELLTIKKKAAPVQVQ